MERANERERERGRLVEGARERERKINNRSKKGKDRGYGEKKESEGG